MAGSVELLRQAVRANFQETETWLDFESSFLEAYKLALTMVNMDVPRYRVVSFTGDGTQTYTLDQSSTGYWDTESSIVKSVEYPISQIPRVYLMEDDDYFIYEDHAGAVAVVFVSAVPIASETFRVTLSSNHTFDDTGSTLGNQAYAALIAKTCEFLCKQLESRLNFTSMPLIDADTVTFNDKPRNFKFLAQYWCEEYKKFVGKSDDVQAAHAMADADIRPMSGGSYMWHGTRNR